MKTAFLSIVLLLSVLACGLYATDRAPQNSTHRISVSLSIKPAPINATVDVNPDTLNLKSNILRIIVYIELQEGYDAASIDISSIVMNNTVQAELKPTAIGDYDNDAIPDLMVKFSGAQIISYIQRSLTETSLVEGQRFAMVSLTVVGQLSDGREFAGSDNIRVILAKPPARVAPHSI